MASKGKVIVITGGTGGIGYQAALELAKIKENTIIVTGRSKESGERAVAAIQSQSGNDDIHLALGDLKLQSGVTALATDLLARFPKIDVLVNNAGNLTVGEKKNIEGVDENVAVNVIAPLMLTRSLVPALKSADPRGTVQITSGGIPIDTLDVNDMEGERKGVGIAAYSHSKRVMEAMSLALSRELQPEGIAVNVVGGGLPGATSMTNVISCGDVPCFVRCCYCCFSCLMKRDDGGKSARACAMPAVWAALASPEELGTGKHYVNVKDKNTGKPVDGKFKPEVADAKNQELVMAYVASKMNAPIQQDMA